MADSSLIKEIWLHRTQSLSCEELKMTRLRNMVGKGQIGERGHAIYISRVIK